ncbi:MAG: D-alanine--D-alanine ligase [Tannerella sp.]|jgi:D-alanine-D-alanine ligase|nr:D-alanine--D-alanine ligase [Tannerella sp.]
MAEVKKNIAIVAGGYSSEYKVSLRSAEGLYSFMDNDTYNIYRVLLDRQQWSVLLMDGNRATVDRNDFSFKLPDGSKVKFDFAYITIHGTPGENGLLQGYFEMLQIPYSTCNPLASALTFNKYTCAQFLKSQGISVPDAIRLYAGEKINPEKIIEQLGLPVFVKPNDGGSSFGVTKVKEAAWLDQAIHKAFQEGAEVVIERFIPGTEVTCGCYKTDRKTVVFPVTEVVTENDFFDYGAKYNGESQEITPARISTELTMQIQHETARIYDIIGAKGLIRIDYIIPSDNPPVMLEINTTPGMTAASFIPQQIKAARLDIKDVMSDIIEHEFKQVIKKANEARSTGFRL